VSATCPSCGASFPEGAAACPSCGAPADGGTVVDPPPSDSAPSIQYDVVTTRWFGVAPATALLFLAAAAAVAAVVLFATGRWPVGLIVSGLVLLLLAAFGEFAKRKPDTTVASRSLGAFRSARERAGVAVETAAARSRAGRELSRARNELFGMQEERRGKVVAIGEAALADDAERVSILKAEIGELDRLAAEKEAEMVAISTRVRAGIAQARLSVQQTQMVELPGAPREPEADPPAPVPTYPPPDEGTPPEPARIPEPYPPDEITPPESASDRRGG
jgi:hypothetical protein